jgi:two-component system cell cycle sensor histidine kinase/response regulator CckA
MPKISENCTYLRLFISGGMSVKRILLAEDESAAMKLFRRMLKPYSLIEATTGEEALLLFIDYDHQVDLLIADLTLPRLSGIHVALLLRSKLPDLPVILTSSTPVSDWRSRDSADLKRLGSHLVMILQKPLKAQVLSNAVCDLIGEPQSERAKTA